jgi:non-ribosomal peptide synthetase component F
VTIPARPALLFPRNFLRWIDAHAVDVTGFTPTYLRLLAAGRALPALGAGPLRLVALGGEALAAADVLGLLDAAPQLRVFNRYGPTETTIAVAHHRLVATDLVAGEPVPVGRPHPGSSFHVLGDDLRPVPAGTPGELWIGGAQLMDGYWHAPELTAAVLRSDVVAGATVYKTGDLARADADGLVTWLDRVDRVVKRRGVRISLAELTDALSGIGAVHAAAALARGPAPDTEILAFVVAEPADLPGVRTALAARLPEAMLPDRIVAVASMPLTNSGKLDERALLWR